MKYFLLLATACILYLNDYAQQTAMLQKWVAYKIKTPNNNPAQEDLSRQIKILDITRPTGNDSYTGVIEYGMPASPVSEPCLIKITGNNISITTPLQTWSGELTRTGKDHLTCTLGSLVYNFKGSPVQRRRKGPAPSFTAEQFYGSWVETGRYDYNNNMLIIDPKDSFYLRITKNNVMYLPGSGNLPMYGNMEIASGNNLNISMTDFKVLSVTEQAMLLDDYNQVIHSFTKTTAPFSFEIKKNEAGPPITENETYPIYIRPESLIRNWYVYKPEAFPGFIKPETGIIRSLNIMNQQEPDSMKYNGKVTFDHMGITKVQDCTLEFSSTRQPGTWVTIVTDDYRWKIEIFKADGKEMIMGKKSDGIRYYFSKN